jgi:hypothetical protein
MDPRLAASILAVLQMHGAQAQTAPQTPNGLLGGSALHNNWNAAPPNISGIPLDLDTAPTSDAHDDQYWNPAASKRWTSPYPVESPATDGHGNTAADLYGPQRAQTAGTPPYELTDDEYMAAKGAEADAQQREMDEFHQQRDQDLAGRRGPITQEEDDAVHAQLTAQREAQRTARAALRAEQNRWIQRISPPIPSAAVDTRTSN